MLSFFSTPQIACSCLSFLHKTPPNVAREVVAKLDDRSSMVGAYTSGNCVVVVGRGSYPTDPSTYASITSVSSHPFIPFPSLLPISIHSLGTLLSNILHPVLISRIHSLIHSVFVHPSHTHLSICIVLIHFLTICPSWVHIFSHESMGSTQPSG